MLTFEEFFKKKKINLPQLQTAEPALFAEFEQHYNQMGEKSFDHTKKYWFNQLRRKYHTPEEPKVEKVVIENKLAEQTITESLSEQPAAPAPQLGFKPKFSTATKPATPVENAPTQPEVKSEQETPSSPPAPEETSELKTTEEAPVPKLGFKPKFKSATPKPVEEAPQQQEETPKVQDIVEPQPEAKPVYKPKFQARNFKPKAEDE